MKYKEESYRKEEYGTPQTSKRHNTGQDRLNKRKSCYPKVMNVQTRTHTITKLSKVTRECLWTKIILWLNVVGPSYESDAKHNY